MDTRGRSAFAPLPRLEDQYSTPRVRLTFGGLGTNMLSHVVLDQGRGEITVPIEGISTTAGSAMAAPKSVHIRWPRGWLGRAELGDPRVHADPRSHRPPATLVHPDALILCPSVDGVDDHVVDGQTYSGQTTAARKRKFA